MFRQLHNFESITPRKAIILAIQISFNPKFPQKSGISYAKIFYLEKHKLDEQWWSHHLDDSGIRSWQGLCFELICKKPRRPIKKYWAYRKWLHPFFHMSLCPGQGEQNNRNTDKHDYRTRRPDIHLCEMKISQKRTNMLLLSAADVPFLPRAAGRMNMLTLSLGCYP